MTDRLVAAPPRADRAVQGVQGVQAVQKDADAYRTISEVAEELGLPQHVLRFWETRFPQVKPLKRAGGRRFYRPEDVDLLRAVQALLYGEGYTIKGVQRLLADHGARQVAEALARSRAVGRAPDPPAGRAEGEAANPARQRLLERTEPFLSAAVAPSRPDAPRPDAFRPDAPRIPADVAGRLSAVHADLVECARLLASVRSTGNC